MHINIHLSFIHPDSARCAHLIHLVHSDRSVVSHLAGTTRGTHCAFQILKHTAFVPLLSHRKEFSIVLGKSIHRASCLFFFFLSIIDSNSTAPVHNCNVICDLFYSNYPFSSFGILFSARLENSPDKLSSSTPMIITRAQ